jgi:hypothetical protein
MDNMEEKKQRIASLYLQWLAWKEEEPSFENVILQNIRRLF